MEVTGMVAAARNWPDIVRKCHMSVMGCNKMATCTGVIFAGVI